MGESTATILRKLVQESGLELVVAVLMIEAAWESTHYHEPEKSRYLAAARLLGQARAS